MARQQPAGLGIYQDSLTNRRDTRPGAGTNNDAAGGSHGENSPLRAQSHHSDSDSTTHEMEMSDLLSEDEGSIDHEETGLTSKTRRTRRTNSSRSTGLDELIAPTGYQSVVPGADLPVATRLVINTLLILAWYTFSLSISLYNKWMFDPKQLNFQLPLFTTSIHMIVQFSLASSVLFFFTTFRPGYNEGEGKARSLRELIPSIHADAIMPLKFYLSRIGPCGLATGMDIGFGNMSLLFITLTFYTMCKSSALGFVLLFAFLFRLESPSWRLVIIITVMTVGVFMMVAGEAEFNAIGFGLIITSSFCSGFRWALTQILLLRHPATSNPFASIFYLAPVMFVSLFFFASIIEGPYMISEQFDRLFEAQGYLLSLGMVLFPGCLAFLMTASEYALLQRTSVVTLSICGIFKEVVTVMVASTVFHDELNLVNLTGLCITIASIAAYNYVKVKKMRMDERERNLAREEFTGH